MKIALDARWIFEKLSGIGVYTQELLRWLPRVDPEHEYLVIYNDPNLRDRTRAETGYAEHPKWKDALIPWGLFSLASQGRLNAWLKKNGVDVFHSTNYMMPLWGNPRHRPGPVKTVVTIHDLIPLVIADHAPQSRKARWMPVYRELMKQIGARADGIIAVSDWSRRDILQHLHIPAAHQEKVVTVPNGVSNKFGLSDVPRQPEILYVGRFDPYKNVTVLIEAFGLAMPRLPEAARLIIIGAPDPRYPEAQEMARSLHLNGRIDWKDYVTGEALIAAYQRARVFVFPSRYEGFGLPVLEAMACGTPVITSTASSLPEVAGEAATLVPPSNAKALAEAMVQVFADDALWQQQHLAGCAQAAKFSWEKTARETARVYHRL